MKLLVIDDSAFARARLERLFEGAGHVVHGVSSAREGLKVYEEIKPDVVTVDLLMPEMNGMDFVRELVKVHPEAQIAVISADIQESTRDEALSAGAALFLSKTNKEDEILKAVEDLSICKRSIVFTMVQRDAFSEMMNIAMGRAAIALNNLIGQKVLLQVPVFELLDTKEFRKFVDTNIKGPCIMVKQAFGGHISGAASLLFTQKHAATLVQELISHEARLDRLSSAEQTVIAEAGNIILNSAISVLGDIIKTRLNINLPEVYLNESSGRISDHIMTFLDGAGRVIILLSNLKIAKTEIQAYLIFSLPLQSNIAILRKLCH